MGKSKAWALVLGPIAVIAAAIIGFVLWEDAAARKRLSAETEPVGLVATPVEWEEGGEDGRQEGHDLTFAWVDAGNGVHTETMERVTWYDAATRYKVCYDPANPSDWRMFETSVRCG